MKKYILIFQHRIMVPNLVVWFVELMASIISHKLSRVLTYRCMCHKRKNCVSRAMTASVWATLAYKSSKQRLPGSRSRCPLSPWPRRCVRALSWSPPGTWERSPATMETGLCHRYESIPEDEDIFYVILRRINQIIK